MPIAQDHGKFLHCRDCNAWVDARAEQCPLCGIAWPTSRWLSLRQDSGLSWRDLAATVGGVAGVVIGLVSWHFWQETIRYGWPNLLRLVFIAGCTALTYFLARMMTTQRAAVLWAYGAIALTMPLAFKTEWLLTYPDGIVGTVLTVGLGGVGWLLGRFFGPMIALQNWEFRQPSNVMTLRASLERRAQELLDSREKMRMLGLRLSQQLPGGTQHPALATLRTAVHATEAQYYSHVIHTWQLTTVLWQNHAQPILGAWRHFTAAECEAAVATLDKMTSDGEQLLQAWQGAPEADDPRAIRAMEQLQRLMSATAHLRQAVLLRQATALAQASPGIHEAFASGVMPGAALSQIDELRQGARFLDLSGAAAELAAENERLRAEQDAIAEVEKLVGKHTP